MVFLLLSYRYFRSHSIPNIGNSMSSGGSVGSDWKNRLYFIPEADNLSEVTYYVEETDLIRNIGRISDNEEQVLKIYAYKRPLISFPFSSLIAYHMFLVLKTKTWWWSIEKNSEGITIQRSKIESAVKLKYRQMPRGGCIYLVKEDTGRKSVHDLIMWLHNENELSKYYNMIYSNCKTFAKRVFDHVAQHYYLFWFNGCFT